MDAFSLLKYWRSSNGGGSGGGVVRVVADGNANGNRNGNVNSNGRNSAAPATATTTIVTAVDNHTSETEEDEEEDEGGNDEGPFFDLEFSLPEGDEEIAKNGGDDVEVAEEEDEDSDGSDGEEEDERELKFTLSSGSSGDSTTEDPNMPLSPSDDLFFKGRLVPVEQTTESNSKQPQFRVSLMKSATKFRVMMLKFKKSKLISNADANPAEVTDTIVPNSKKEEPSKTEREESDKPLTVKFKVEQVPIVSLFTRENSSKAPKTNQQNVDESVSSEDKKFSKEAMQRYLRKVKPLYVRVSKKYGEKLKFSGQLSLSGAIKANLSTSPSTAEQMAAKSEKESPQEVQEPPLLSSNSKGVKQSNLPAGLRVVCKHLGKSRSASAAVAAAPPGAVSSKRRDDSLLQQQDGIQGAILHCKRSFKACREMDSSILSRSTSDSLAYEKDSSSSSSSTSSCSSDKAGTITKETGKINRGL